MSDTEARIWFGVVVGVLLALNVIAAAILRRRTLLVFSILLLSWLPGGCAGGVFLVPWRERLTPRGIEIGPDVPYDGPVGYLYLVPHVLAGCTLMTALIVAIYIACGAPRSVDADEVETDEEEPHCGNCGYLLVGLSEKRCPECGTVFGDGQESGKPRHTSS
jgi:hypothetical protein